MLLLPLLLARRGLVAFGRGLHLVAVLLGASLVLLTGCATAAPPPPLRPTFDDSRDVAQQLQARTTAHEERLRLDLRRRVGACPTEPQEEHRRCGLLAARDAIALADPERLVLWQFTSRYDEAKEALRTAQECQRQGDQVCQERQRARAADLLGQLRADLRAGGTP